MRLAKPSQFIPLQNVVYFITLTFLVRKIFTFYTNDVLLLNVHFQGQRVNYVAGSTTFFISKINCEANILSKFPYRHIIPKCRKEYSHLSTTYIGYIYIYIYIYIYTHTHTHTHAHIQFSIPLTNTSKPMPVHDSEPIQFSTHPQNKTSFHKTQFNIIR